MMDVVLFVIVVVLPAIVLHELAHAGMAYLLGDHTAKHMGRLTLNPIKHLDWVGSLLLPGGLFILYKLNLLPSLVLFGWAKPVPVNFAMLKPRRLGMCLVAGAGPLVNVFLAWIFVLVFKFLQLPSLNFIWYWGVLFNLMLAVFNMLPIPPLDGSKFVYAVLPRRIARALMSLEMWGLVIVLILLNLGLLGFIYPVIQHLAMILGMSL